MRTLQVVAPPLAAAWAETLFRTPRRYPAPPREQEWLRDATPFAVDVVGETLPAWSWGDGAPVLLVHGWEGRGSQMGALARGLAAAGFRAVVFDGPGHGAASGRLSSLPQLAAAVAAVAARVSAENGPLRAIVAHSFGAAASSWALAQGLIVDRLVLLAPPSDLDGYITQFGRLLGASRRTLDGLLRRIEERFGIRWAEARRPAAAAARVAPDLPVLVVHDDDDGETAWAEGAEVARTFPAGALVTTSGLGHRRLLRDAGVVATVAAFAAATGEPSRQPMVAQAG